MPLKIDRAGHPTAFVPRESRRSRVSRLFDGIQQPVRDAFTPDPERVPIVDRVIADVVNSTSRWTLVVDGFNPDEEPTEGDLAAATLKRGRWR